MIEHNGKRSTVHAEFPDDAITSEELVDKAKTALVSAKIMGGSLIKFFDNLED